MRNILKQRKETIDGSHERANELEAQIDEKMARYEAKLQEAKLQGKDVGVTALPGQAGTKPSLKA